MNEDMSEMLKNFTQMMNNNSETNNQDNSKDNKNVNPNDASNSSSDTNNIFGNIDMNTIFKIQQIMNSLNSKENDSRTNLLMSLKPYLKESRKNKVDQYIQLIKMEKVFEIMNPLGGDKRNV